MQRQVTNRISEKEPSSITVIRVNGENYWTATAIVDELGIARQTLWRWRRESKVPKGRLYRGKLVVFTKQEVVRIRDFANRLSPIEI